MIEVSYNGPGFLSLLTLLFIGLKLTSYISWSWWMVLSPMLIGVPLAITCLLCALVVLIKVKG